MVKSGAQKKEKKNGQLLMLLSLGWGREYARGEGAKKTPKQNKTTQQQKSRNAVIAIL